jgi:hypothetical protein
VAVIYTVGCVGLSCPQTRNTKGLWQAPDLASWVSNLHPGQGVCVCMNLTATGHTFTSLTVCICLAATVCLSSRE